MSEVSIRPRLHALARHAAALTAGAALVIAPACAVPAAHAAGGDDQQPAASPSSAALALGLHRPDFGGALASGAKLGALPGPVPKGAKVTYQWLKGGKAIKGATHKAYTIRKSDSKAKLSVKITVKAPGKSAVTQKSVARTISPLTKSVTSRPVSISGTPKVGATLKAKPGKWSPKATKYSYRWTRNGWPITGGTHGSYKVTDRDAGASIGLIVTGKAKGRASVVAIAPAKTVPAPVKTEPPAPTPPAPTPPAPQPPTPQPPATTPTQPPADTPTTPPADRPTDTPTDDPTTPPPTAPIDVPALATSQSQAYIVDQRVPLTPAMLEVIQYTVPTWTYTGADNKFATVPALAGADSVEFGLYGPVTSPATTLPATPVITSEKFTVTQLREAGVIYDSVNDGSKIILAKGLTSAQLAAVDALVAGSYTITMTVTKAGYNPIVATFDLVWAIKAPVAVPEVATGESQTYAKNILAVPTQEDLVGITYTVPTWTYPEGKNTTVEVPALVNTDSVVFALYPAAVEAEPGPDPSTSDAPSDDATVPGNTDDTEDTEADDDSEADDDGPLVSSDPFTVAELVEYGVLVPGEGDDAGKYTIILANGLHEDQLEAIDELAEGNYTIQMTVTKRGFGPLVATFDLEWTFADIAVPPVSGDRAGEQPPSFKVESEGSNISKETLAEAFTWNVPTWTYSNHGTPEEITLENADHVVLGLYAGASTTPVFESASYTVEELQAYCVLAPVPAESAPGGETVEVSSEDPCTPGEPSALEPGTAAEPGPLQLVPAMGLWEDQLALIGQLPSGSYTVKMTVTRDGYDPFAATFSLTWEALAGTKMLVLPVDTGQTEAFAPAAIAEGIAQQLAEAVHYTLPVWADIRGESVPLQGTDKVNFTITQAPAAGSEEVSSAFESITAGPYTMAELGAAGVITATSGTGNPPYTLTPGAGLKDSNLLEPLAAADSGTYILTMTVTPTNADGATQYSDYIATFEFEWTRPVVSPPSSPVD
ncbi:MAG: hypothetical protein LBK59_09150 [Bifidobacteriaceae bacterium]|jgi:hypothetical protein|nr:hypothetical protein [Bifidobacteriaceae bacterium]